MKDPNRFYVYVYLDPRKPGKYEYGSYCFLYEPFYVGKGCGNRFRSHLYYADNSKYSYNTFNVRKIQNIRRDCGSDPFILKVRDSMLESDAFDLERDLVNVMGIASTHPAGILTNLQYGGKGGCTHTQESKENMRFRMSLAGMIDRHGEDKGTCMWNKRLADTSATSKMIWAKGESGLSKFIRDGGNSNTPELIAKRVAKVKGRKMSPQYCANCRERVPKGRDHEWTGVYVFKDPAGREYLSLDGMHAFCKDYAISMPAMKSILHGKLVCGHYKGWTVRYATPKDVDDFKDRPNPKVDADLQPFVPTGINPGTKNYVMTDPKGIEHYWINGIPKFCSKYKIPVTAMREIVQGRSLHGHYKGWTARYATPEDAQYFKEGEAL